MDALFLAEFMGMLARGVQNFETTQYVLRRVQTAPAGATLKANDKNVLKVFKSGNPPDGSDVPFIDIVIAENIPDTIRWEMPEGFWTKQTPTVEQQGDGRYQITQEWWHSRRAEPL